MISARSRDFFSLAANMQPVSRQPGAPAAAGPVADVSAAGANRQAWRCPGGRDN